ncbi:MAG: HAD-IC family P-type ATPase, partial [Candidatus Nanohaloarchaea archaeon]|nr:HAD-IC family P-type ATPase [Candidatus Nanohaloarchaea archaeon]
DSDSGFIGDPTEMALLISADKAGIEVEEERVREIPFSSDRKRMTVITENDGYTAWMKGAPETVLDRCDRILIDGEERELTREIRDAITNRNSEFAGEALRVLGLAYREVKNPESDDSDVEDNMVFLGLQGMIDPPREEVKEAVQDCRDAGIRVIMATGDNIETAKAVGEQIGFDPEGALTGKEIEGMSDEELEEKAREVEIFARVSPSHKVRILEALKANGHRVAMTGDGVNDAPALKDSDVGVAMGVRGTDVAQQASDMVLQDDNFVTIRDAIAEGRGIFDNIRKFVNYLLSANAGEVLVVFFGVLIGSLMFPEVFSGGSKALILTPVMLLWINLVTDGLPALALGADPKSEGIMDRSPRGKDESVISGHIMGSIIGIGVIMAVTLLPAFFTSIGGGSLIQAQTVLFTAMVVFEMVRIQLIRQRYDQSIFSNLWLLVAVLASLIMQLVVVYTPINRFFEVVPLDLGAWSYIAVSFAGFVVLAVVLEKFLDRVFDS